MGELPFQDRTDFENAERGLVDALDPCVVKAADGGWSGTWRPTPTWTARLPTR
jgi:alkyl sulfatase BDS1-like metallo-beta-lactamase superfamily hydrolase